MGNENVMIQGTTGAARVNDAAPIRIETKLVATTPVFQFKLKAPSPSSETRTQRHRFGIARRVATKIAVASDATKQRMLMSSHAYWRAGLPARVNRASSSRRR